MLFPKISIVTPVYNGGNTFELELFTPVIKVMKVKDFFIELHDDINPLISTILKKRFSKTHYVELVKNRQVKLNMFCVKLNGLSDEDKQYAISEPRVGYNKNIFMEWASMKAL